METCPDCSIRPHGPLGHPSLVHGGPVNFRQSIFQCAACEQLWRRHSSAGDIFYWQAETMDPRLDHRVAR